MKTIEWTDEDGDKGQIREAANEDREGKIYIEIRTRRGDWRAVYLTFEVERELYGALRKRRKKRKPKKKPDETTRLLRGFVEALATSNVGTFMRANHISPDLFEDHDLRATCWQKVAREVLERVDSDGH